MAKKIAGNTRKPGVNPVHSGAINFLKYYDEEKLLKAKKYLLARYDESKSWRAAFRNRWIRHYQNYCLYSAFYQEKPDYQAAYYVPVLHEIVETVTAQFQSAYFDTYPLFTAIPATPEMKSATRAVESLLATRQDQTNYLLTSNITTKENILYGTAWQKLQFVDTASFTGVYPSAPDAFDVFPDPLHPDPDDMRYIIHRGISHQEELDYLESLGVYQDVGKVTRKSGVTVFSPHDRLRTIGSLDCSDESLNDYHETLEYWGRWIDPDTKESFDVVMVLADRDRLIRFEECPYQLKIAGEDFWYAQKPFVKFINIVMPGEVYGRSDADVVEYICYNINDLTNAKMDAINLTLSPVYQVYLQGLEDQDRINFYPGAMIPVTRPDFDAIKPVTKDMTFQVAYGEIEGMKKNARDATVGDTMQGREGNIRKTAFEVSTLANFSLSRMKPRLQINEIGISRLGRMWYQMEHQFTDEKINIKIFDAGEFKAFANISPTQMKFQGDFKLQVASQYGAKNEIITKNLEFLKVASSIPNSKVNPDAILENIADLLNIPKKNLFITEKEQAEAAPPPLPPITPGGAMANIPEQYRPMQPSIPTNPEDMMRVAAALRQQIIPQ